MKYNFDEIIERKNTNSVKWDLTELLYGEKDLLPAWVADMDFKSPPAVIESLKKRAEHGIFGYSAPLDSYFDSVVNWLKSQHQWTIDKNWIITTPGIVPALNWLVTTFTEPGDGVIIQQPVYYPFMDSIKNNGRKIVNNPLIKNETTYTIDFNDLEEKAKAPDVKMLILCSPHNPVGRVWKKDELRRVGEICTANNILVIADEIHGDLTSGEHKHTPFGSLSQEFLRNSITCTSPSKTFNLAGLQISNIIIENLSLRKKFKDTLKNNGIFGPNPFAIDAVKAAYNHSLDWYSDLKKYLLDNYLFLKEYLNKHIPEVKVTPLEGTYLAWLDFNFLNISTMELKKLLSSRAKVALSQGFTFGSEGDGFIRINLATPRAILKEVLDRVRDSL